GMNRPGKPSSLAGSKGASAVLDTPTLTPTITLIITPSLTPSLTPTRTATPSCPQNYTITRLSLGTFVPGSSYVSGSDCDDCSVRVTLPFTYYFYTQPFSAVSVVSNGLLAFTDPADVGFNNYCIPDPHPRSNVIYPLWRDLTMDGTLEQCAGIGCGVYTSVSGGAPNRI